MPQASFFGLQAALTRALPVITRRLRGRLLPFAVFLGLLVLAAYLAARLTWQLAAPSAALARTEHTAVATSSRNPARDRAAQIAAAHLFGTAAETAQQLAAQNAPETSLDLTLLGVAAGRSGAPSQAIIASGNSAQNTYPVGATLPGGAVIRDILPDRVVLAHNGHLENLSLPMAGTSLLSAKMSFGSSDSASAPQRSPNAPSAAQVRRDIEQHPQTLADFMRLRPQVHNGHLQGYRVFPGEYPGLFREAGLQPGDIVTQVNGIALNNPGNSLRGISRLRNAKGPVHLVVLRQGKTVDVTVNIPGG